MSISRSANPAESFIVGTIGAPGEREFFLQAKFQSAIYSFAIDKSQVSALADRMAILIGELKAADYRFENIIATALQVPLISEFQVGAMGITWLPQSEQVLIELQELSEIADESAESDEANTFKLYISPDIANNFVILARRVVSAGRLPCPFCGLPINKEGHLCPRANGYRR